MPANKTIKMISNDFRQLPPSLQVFIRDQVPFPSGFKSAIGERDEMYLFALQNHGIPEKARIRYYFNGLRIFDAVRQVVQWKFKEFNQINSFLDFAAGYGRFTRFLLQKLPPEKVWVSDIYSDAVQFQRENFGVNGIVSTVDPESYSPGKQFDCILACSFFSHLPEKTFGPWMKTLYNLMSSEGILMFSVHDRDLLPAGSKIKSDEILFIPQSESASLDANEYGTSYVGEEFVTQTVNRVSNGRAICYRIPDGICRYQDLYLVAKPPVPNFENWQFFHHPWGRVERVNLNREGELEIGGWVSEINPGGQIELILISVNGEEVKRVKPPQNHPQNSRLDWEICVKHPGLSPADVILVKALNSGGFEWVFEAATLEVLLATNGQPG